MRLCNTHRAQQLMAENNIDGLIAYNPINQYYLSNYWGLFNTAGGYEGAYMSLLPAKDIEAAALIIPALELRRLKTTAGTWMTNLFSYFTDADEKLEPFADSTPQGQPYSGWQTAEDHGDLTDLESDWLSIVDNYGSQMSPNAFWALSRAIKNAGLENSTLAVDDPRLAQWLNNCQLDKLTVIYRPQLFNEIRLQKTAAEITIMSQAAIINERSLLKAANSFYEGISWTEVQTTYMTEMATQGGRGVYVMCGLGELPAGKVRRGEPVMLDALGQYQRYHGDFGRCVVVGEATAKHRLYHQAICAGWETAQNLLKPGIHYSDLSRQVGNAVRKAGIKQFRDPVVHSLGLEHTDDPKPAGVMPQTKDDQILQQNMVINVDLPHTEIGWGSVHVEDTVVITADGYNRLSQASLDLIVCS
ncbi:MAG: Xaa-Pro aminopeptidase [Pseudohongiellaceae bacterium]|jgi:Xaa-Pro aminopeptidase